MPMVAKKNDTNFLAQINHHQKQITRKQISLLKYVSLSHINYSVNAYSIDFLRVVQGIYDITHCAPYDSRGQ